MAASLAGRVYALRGIAARGVSIVATFAMTLMISKALPPALSGAFFTPYAVFLGVATVVRFGTESLALKRAAADPALVRPLLRPMIITSVGFTTLGAVIMAAYLLWYVPTTSPEAAGTSTWALIAMAAALVPFNLVVVGGAVLRGLGRVASGAVAELGSVPLIVSGVIAALYLARVHVSLSLVLWVFAAAVVVTCAWTLPLTLAALRRGSTPAAAQPTTAYLREHGRSLGQFMITGLGFYLFASIPTILLGTLSTTTQATFFNGARTLANIVGTVPTIQISYLGPRFANLYHRGQVRSLNRLVRSSTINGSLVAGVIAVPLIVAPTFFLHLYRPEFAGADATLRLLSVAALLQVILGPVNGLLVTCGLERFAARLTMIMLVLGTIGMLVAVQWGAPAVAFVNALANICFVVAGSIVLQRHAGIVSPVGLPLAWGADDREEAPDGDER